MRIICGVCTALALLAAPALAQSRGQSSPQSRGQSSSSPQSSAGQSESTVGGYLSAAQEPGKYTVNVNGGVGGYLGGLSDFTGVGPVWGVNVDGNATRGIGWELAYSGARTPLTSFTPLVPEGEGVWRHGVNAMAKLFAPGMETTIRPFAGVGFGAAYLDPSDGAEALRVPGLPKEKMYQKDWVTELPVALGVEVAPSGAPFTAGLRANYRFQGGEEFAKGAAASDNKNNPEGGLLSAALTVGGKF